jgi:hypothetical protein
MGRQEGALRSFEVIVGKSMSEDRPSRCFGFVQTYDEKPKRRLFELLKGQGMQMNQRVMFFSDGGTDIREVQQYNQNPYRCPSIFLRLFHNFDTRFTIAMATTAPERSKEKASAKSLWNSFLVWGGPVGAVLLASFLNEPLGNLGLWLGRAVVNFCHTAPFLVGATVLLVLWLLYWALGHNPNPLETVRGADKRWSTSKLQFFCWTVMVIFSYATVYAALIGARALVKIG